LRKLTNIEFINKSIKCHGNKYDYSKVNYENSKKHVNIICKKHGIFSQLPNNHLMGHGCAKCRTLRKNSEEIIREFVNKHGNKYDYSLVEYKGSSELISIICENHGIFQQLPYSHLSGRGCGKCDRSHKLTLSEYIKKATEVHSDKYDYSKTIYNGSSNSVKIICPKHGSFERVATEHLNGAGCKICDGNSILSKRELKKFFKELYNNKYNYNLDNYVNVDSIIVVVCPEHGEFETKVKYHKSGHECKRCKKVISKGEEKIAEILNFKCIKYVKEMGFNGCVNKNKLPFDFYLPDYNICIEYDGIQHFEPRFGMSEVDYSGIIKRDKIKDKYCKENNIYLIRIPYYDYNNIEGIIKEKII